MHPLPVFISAERSPGPFPLQILETLAPHLPGGSALPAATLSDVAAALSCLARAQPAAATAAAVRDARFAKVLDVLLELIQSEPTPRYVSNALHSLAKLRAPLGERWWSAFWAATEPTLSGDTWNSQDCSNALWAVAVLGAAPPESWLARIFEASEASLGEAKPQSMSNTLIAAQMLSSLPPRSWLDRFVRESLRPAPPGPDHRGPARDGCLLWQFTNQALANSAHSLGVLGWEPPAAWMRAFFVETSGRMAELTPQEAANIIYGLGLLRATPPEWWLQRFFAETGPRLGTFASQGLSNVVYAAYLLEEAPPDDWMRSFFAATGAVMDLVAPEPASQGAAPFAVPQRGCSSPRRMVRLAGPAPGGERAVHPMFFSNTVFVLSELSLRPPPGWLHKFFRATEAHLGLFNAQELSNALLGLACLSPSPPPAPWLGAFWAAADAQLGTFSRQGLCNVLWSAACLGCLSHPVARRMWALTLAQLGEAIRGLRPDEEVNELHLRQCFQVSLWSALLTGAADAPAATLAAAPLNFGGDSALHDLAREKWERETRSAEGSSRSPFEENVREVVGAVCGAEAPQASFPCELSLRAIDLALVPGASWPAGAEGPGWAPALASTPVAIEVDGPVHWLRCFPDHAGGAGASAGGEPPALVADGRTVLRNRTLALAGWALVSVPHFEWNALGQRQHAREEYLRRRISEAVEAHAWRRRKAAEAPTTLEDAERAWVAATRATHGRGAGAAR